jgi:hypothetical protein
VTVTLRIRSTKWEPAAPARVLLLPSPEHILPHAPLRLFACGLEFFPLGEGPECDPVLQQLAPPASAVHGLEPPDAFEPPPQNLAFITVKAVILGIAL